MNGATTSAFGAGGPGVGTIGTILDRVWAILRGQFRVFLMLGTVPAGAMVLSYALILGGLFAAGVMPPPPNTSFSPEKVVLALFPAMLAAMIPIMVAYALQEAAVCHVTLAANRGVASSFKEAYGAAALHAGRYIWLMVLRWLAIVLPALAAWAIIGGSLFLNVGRQGTHSPETMILLFPLIVLGYLGTLVYFVWMTLRLGLAYPASLAEGLAGATALKRSFRLTRSGFWRILLICLVMYAISYAAILLFELAVFAVGVIGLFAFTGLHLNAALGIGLLVVFGVLFFLAMMLLSALMWAAYAIAFTVIYEDQRLRLEPAVLMQGGPA